MQDPLLDASEPEKTNNSQEQMKGCAESIFKLVVILFIIGLVGFIIFYLILLNGPPIGVSQ